MQINLEDISGVKKVLKFEIPVEVVNQEIDDAYRELKKTAKVKGFRPGKTPRQVLERLYKKEVHADISSKLIQESFSTAIQEKNLRIVGNPEIVPSEIVYQQPYTFEITVEVRPEISDIDFKGLALKKTRYQVMDEEVDAQIKMLQRNMTRHEPLGENRPVREGDWVLTDYEGFKDGQPFESTQKTENFSMKIGSAKIARELDEAMIGCLPGEARSVPVPFPEDYRNKALAGLTIDFKILVKEIRKEVVPEITDAFAANFGPYDNLDQLKAEIVKNLTQGYEKRIEQELNEQIFTALIGRSEFEVPDTMIEYELDGIISDAERSFTYHNMDMAQIGLTREKLGDRYRDVAVKQVKRHLILDKIITQEKVSLTAEEIDRGMADMAQQFAQPVDEIKAYYNNPENSGGLEYLKHTLLEKKVIKLIIDHSTIEETDPVKSARNEA